MRTGDVAFCSEGDPTAWPVTSVGYLARRDA
jgi:hypothetical protein